MVGGACSSGRGLAPTGQDTQLPGGGDSGPAGKMTHQVRQVQGPTLTQVRSGEGEAREAGRAGSPSPAPLLRTEAGRGALAGCIWGQPLLAPGQERWGGDPASCRETPPVPAPHLLPRSKAPGDRT